MSSSIFSSFSTRLSSSARSSRSRFTTSSNTARAFRRSNGFEVVRGGRQIAAARHFGAGRGEHLRSTPMRVDELAVGAAFDEGVFVGRIERARVDREHLRHRSEERRDLRGNGGVLGKTCAAGCSRHDRRARMDRASLAKARTQLGAHRKGNGTAEKARGASAY
jgi:hypothetical protein